MPIIKSEYMIDFLDGLNDFFFFFIFRSPVLLMDPILPISKVFALVSQEEKHQTIGVHGSLSLDSTNALAMVTKTDSRTKANNINSFFLH